MICKFGDRTGSAMPAICKFADSAVQTTPAICKFPEPSTPAVPAECKFRYGALDAVPAECKFPVRAAHRGQRYAARAYRDRATAPVACQVAADAAFPLSGLAQATAGLPPDAVPAPRKAMSPAPPGGRTVEPATDEDC